MPLNRNLIAIIALIPLLFLACGRHYPSQAKLDLLVQYPTGTNSAEKDESFAKSLEVIQTRIISAGFACEVTDESPSEGRIRLEVGFNGDPGLVKNLVSARGKLEFRETIPYAELFDLLERSNAILRDVKGEFGPADTLLVNDPEASEAEREAAFHHIFPLFARLELTDLGMMDVFPETPRLGFVHITDTAEFMRDLLRDEVIVIWPDEMELLFSAYPTDWDPEVVELIAVRSQSFLTNNDITKASQETRNGNQLISIIMTEEGGKLWSDLTARNLNQSLALVYDGKVLSYPRVMAQITGGKTELTGNFNEAQAASLAACISNPALPYRVIIENMSVQQTE